MGRNGSGKSSLLWALQGARPRARRAGRRRRRRPGRPRSRPRRRALVGLVPQTRRRPALPRDRRRGVRGRRRRHRRLPGDPGPAGPGIPGDRHPRDLSEGQRLALALAIVLAARAAAWCCSTSRRGGSTTPPSARWPASCAALADDGHAVLVATHDVEFVAQVADEVVVLADGEVVSSGPVRRVRRRVAGVRPAGHQGARPAVAARGRGRRGPARRGVAMMAPRAAAVPLTPRSAPWSSASPRSPG